MFTIWIIGVVVIGMYLGYRYGQATTDVRDEIGTMLIVIVLFWPFVLALAIVLAPFAGMVYLGARSKKKEK
jgi:Na+/proline symporter